MIQEDKQNRGVGMQNFCWPVECDQFMHLLTIESPKTFRLVKQYLPAQTESSYWYALSLHSSLYMQYSQNKPDN